MPIEDRSQYLSLAALGQTVVDSLLAYVEDDDWQELEKSLGAIVEPLRAAAGRPVPAAGGQSPAFSGYEHRRTVAQVWETEAERQEVAQDLERLLALGNVPASKQEARQLIKPLQRLANQALWNFEQPSDPVLRGVFELCKVP